MVWPDRELEAEASYDLRNGESVAPQTTRGLPRRSLPTLGRSQLVFGDLEITWGHWVETWQQDPADQDQQQDSVASVRLLP